MNFYIIDDDPAIPLVLQQILEKEATNTVVGIAHTAQQALHDLLFMHVDIILIDLLLPDLSGINLVQQLKARNTQSRFIMISQVRDADLRVEAYQAGIEFFIDKPINVIEVKMVVEKVAQSIQMTRQLTDTQSLVDGHLPAQSLPVNPHQDEKDRILSILKILGISSEAGSADILSVCQLMLDQQLSFREIDFHQAYHITDHEKKIMFQRIRRAIKVGLTNFAHLCMDNMGDEIIVERANLLFEYKNVRNEMLYLEGSRQTGGKTSLQHFFDGLVQN